MAVPRALTMIQRNAGPLLGFVRNIMISSFQDFQGERSVVRARSLGARCYSSSDRTHPLSIFLFVVSKVSVTLIYVCAVPLDYVLHQV